MIIERLGNEKCRFLEENFENGVGGDTDKGNFIGLLHF